MSNQTLLASATRNSRVDNNNRRIKIPYANSSQRGQTGKSTNSKKKNNSSAIFGDDDIKFASLSHVAGAFNNPVVALGWMVIQDAILCARESQCMESGIFLLHPNGGLREHIEFYGLQIKAELIQKYSERLYNEEQLEEIDGYELDMGSILPAPCINPEPVLMIKTIPVPAIKAPVPAPINQDSIKSPAVPVTGNVIVFLESGKNSAGLGNVPPSSDYTDFLADFIFTPTHTPPKKSNKCVRINRGRNRDLVGQMHFPFLAQLQSEEFSLAA